MIAFMMAAASKRKIIYNVEEAVNMIHESVSTGEW